MLENNIQLTVFGHGWDSKIKGFSNCEIFDAVYHEKMWENMHRYRIQLNIFREHNAGSHNMRTFEIPAIGGIQLAPDTIEHRAFFEPGKEIFLYRGIEESISQINTLLAINLDKAKVLRLAARNRIIKSNYSYKERSRSIVNFFKSI